MSELATIASLLALRRRRERRALEAVSAQMQRARAAEQAVAAAKEALQQHDVATDEREHALLAPLIGRPVPQPQIARMRRTLEVLAFDRGRLDAEQKTANAAQRSEAEALTEARAEFAARRRAASKLDGLHARAAKRHVLRQEAVAESEQESVGIPAGSPSGARKT